MNLFTLLGMVVFTGLVCYTTVWFGGLMFMSVAFAGWESLKGGTIYIILLTVAMVFMWFTWWHFIGSQVNITWG